MLNQTADALAFVRRYKDHPAVLMWGVGNEVALNSDPEQVFPEINALARAIKEVDPDHPTMTAIAGVWPRQGEQFARLCPDVDILGVNAYSGIFAVPQELVRQGYKGPYILTEFGATGHWESGLSMWDAPVEQTSAGKFRSYAAAYEVGVLSQPDRCLGAYVFLWGQKQERTETWYGMFLKSGEKLPPVDAMAHQWTGRYPPNQSPRVERLETDLMIRRVPAGAETEASVVVRDPEGDELSFRWVVKRESSDRRGGGDAETEPETIETAFKPTGRRSVKFTLPEEPGAYRLFVFAYDGHGGAGTANVPFMVE